MKVKNCNGCKFCNKVKCLAFHWKLRRIGIDQRRMVACKVPYIYSYYLCGVAGMRVTALKKCPLKSHGICEKCGAPGTEVHHIIPLNETNVDDPSISLNPDNVMLLCKDCHEAIHQSDRPVKKG